VTKIKCVIAAGGLGTRLQGFRQNDKTKILLEVNGMPMINRQINQINNWGIEEFIIITSPDFDELTREVTRNTFPNLNINYSIQETPEGISHAFSKAEKFVDENDILLLVLGDNFFGENPLNGINFENFEKNNGCIIFTKNVDNPSEFGVAEVDNKGNVLLIEEKPKTPKSNLAVVGIYIFDHLAMDNIKQLEPSDRGEYEITDLINIYINQSSCLNVELSDWWIDAGTPDRIIELESKLL
tara:strand:- start:1156 stop:1878 length:723 start_codon:yes stop_codon:yes gene_type:complete